MIFDMVSLPATQRTVMSRSVDHADEGAVAGHGNGADIELAHFLGDRVDRGVGRNACDALMHHVFHFHGGNSSAAGRYKQKTMMRGI
jgi:hypothetical protein